MKKLTLIAIAYGMISFQVCAQGTQNNFEYDEADFNVILKELGFQTFKFPVQQNKEQLYDIVIDEYENGELIRSISIIDDTREKFEDIGLDPTSYFLPKTGNDSSYFYRFYLHHMDSLVRLKVKIHGIESKYDFDFKDKSTYDSRALFATKTEIDSLSHLVLSPGETKPLMFLYANAADNRDGTLFCPAGYPLDQLIKQFYYVIYVSLRPHEG